MRRQIFPIHVPVPLVSLDSRIVKLNAMYEQFYGLAELPFNLTPDSRFLFMSRKHREALAALMFGVQERKGFVLLSGEIGSGKTMLCRALHNDLRTQNARAAVIFNSFLSDIDLLRTVNDEFGIESYLDTKKELIDRLNHFLIEETRRGKNLVLIFDEAQNLPMETLEQIRMLGNLESETTKLLQIVLVGQPELNQILARPELEQLNQRISVRYHVSELHEDEILHYIRHRLMVAQCKKHIEFTAEAIDKITDFSGGIPRKINLLCDRCLLAGFVASSLSISGEMVDRAILEVGGRTDLARASTPPAPAASSPSAAARPEQPPPPPPASGPESPEIPSAEGFAPQESSTKRITIAAMLVAIIVFGIYLTLRGDKPDSEAEGPAEIAQTEPGSETEEPVAAPPLPEPAAAPSERPLPTSTPMPAMPPSSAWVATPVKSMDFQGWTVTAVKSEAVPPPSAAGAAPEVAPEAGPRTIVTLRNSSEKKRIAIASRAAQSAPEAPAPQPASPTPAVVADAALPAAPPPPPAAPAQLSSPPLEESYVGVNWAYDKDRIVRVTNVAHSKIASVLTVSQIWNVVLDLSVFRNASPAQLSQLDIFEMVRRQLKFHVCDLGTDLHSAVSFDLPIIFKIDPQGSGEAPYQVVVARQANTLAMADPLSGRRQVDALELRPRIQQIYVLYRDNDNLADIKPGERSERVQRLQEFLARGRWMNEPLNSTFDARMGEGLSRFQDTFRLQKTGILDDWTAMLIASRLLPDRPRLQIQ